jgi:hypothetical protein
MGEALLKICWNPAARLVASSPDMAGEDDRRPRVSGRVQQLTSVYSCNKSITHFLIILPVPMVSNVSVVFYFLKMKTQVKADGRRSGAGLPA